MNGAERARAWLCAGLACTAGALVVAGCTGPSVTGERTTVVPAPGGPTKVTQKGDTVHIDARTETGEQFTATVGSEVKESELGLPVYPGAALRAEGGMRRTTSPAGATVTGTFTTPDAPSRVIDFYADKVTVQQKLDLNGRGMLSGTRANGEQVTVMSGPSRTGEGTEIVIVVQRR